MFCVSSDICLFSGGIFASGMCSFLCLCYVHLCMLSDCAVAARYSLRSSRALRARWPRFASPLAGQCIESVTDWAIRITDWGLFPDWVSSHARLADAIRPIPNKGKSWHSGLSIALISRLPDWVVQSVLPIAIHRLLHRLYPLPSQFSSWRNS